MSKFDKIFVFVFTMLFFIEGIFYGFGYGNFEKIALYGIAVVLINVLEVRIKLHDN